MNSKELHFGSGKRLVLTSQVIRSKDKHFAEYPELKAIKWNDIRRHINGVAITEEFYLRLTLASGKSYAFREEIDIRSALFRMPFAHIFSREKRRAKRHELNVERQHQRERFGLFVELLQTRSGVVPQRMQRQGG